MQVKPGSAMHCIKSASRCASIRYRRLCRALLLKLCLPLPPRLTRFSSVLLSPPALRGACSIDSGTAWR